MAGAAPTDPSQVRYIEGDPVNNAVLLSVMRPLWKRRCYWCNEPVAFRYMAVDHIIPRTVSAERLAELTAKFELPADFAVHGPANLAPICTPCNTRKGSTAYDRPALLDHLRHAAAVADTVAKRAVSFWRLDDLAPALLKVLNADLADPEIQTALFSYTPDLLDIAVALNPDAVGDVVARQAEVDLGLDFGPVTLTFAWRTVAAADLLEEVTARPAPQALEEAVDQLVALMCRRVQDGLAHLYGPHGPVSAGPAEADDATITLAAATFDRTETSLDIAFTGTLYSQFETTLTQSGLDGDGLEDLHAETEATGRFSLTVSCDLAAPAARPAVADVRITRWHPSTVLWNSTELSYVNYEEPE